MGCTTLDLREKDVINMCDGKKLGCIGELEIDPECGRITAIIVSPESFTSMLFSKNQIRIPWDKIIRIGCDTILVDSPHSKEECSCSTSNEKNKKCKWWQF